MRLINLATATALTISVGCGSSEETLSDYELGRTEGYQTPDRIHQEHPLTGELRMDVGDEAGYTPSVEGRTIEYQQGVAEGYYHRRGEIDQMQKPAFSERVDNATSNALR